MAQASDKSELIAELARSRQVVAHNVRALGQDLNVVQKVRTSVQKNQLMWLSGAALLGAFIARPGKRKVIVKTVPAGGGKAAKGGAGSVEKEVVKAGIFVTVLKLIFDIVRPFATKWLARRVASYAEERFLKQ